MSPASKNLIIILGLVTVAYGGYYFVTRTNPDDALITDAALEQMLLSTQVFIDYRQTLDQIVFDFSLFEDNRFRTLRSYSQPVEPKPEGRANPFAPVGTGGSPINSTP